MEKWIGRVALVTGASAGIGAALTKKLVSHGMKVVACARNLDRLQELAESLKDGSGEVCPVKCDLRNEAEILSMFGVIKEKYGRLDVCVNNAGLAHPSLLLDGSSDKWREMWDVNVMALAICTRESFKMMEAAGVKDGYILHISSMSGHRCTSSDISFYTMTKHAVKAHTEGVRRELREKNSDIRITAVSPGNVDTEFIDRMYVSDTELREKNAVQDYKWLQASDIVDACVYALSTPAHTQVHDILIRPTKQVT